MNLQFLDIVVDLSNFEEVPSTFGAWLHLHRKDRRLTMEALAKKVGISKQYVSVLERGEPHALTGRPVVPKVELVDALAKALDADADEARLNAGYAPRTNPDEGFFKGLDKLSPEDQKLAKRQIRAIIDSFDVDNLDDDDLVDDDYDESKDHRVE